MVQLLAFQLRLPPPRRNESRRLATQREIGRMLASFLLKLLQGKRAAPSAEAGRADLAGLLLRTHAPQAAARQLAAIAESGAWRDDSGAALRCIGQALRVASGLGRLVAGAIAVAESRLLEHAGRLLVLLAEPSEPQRTQLQVAFHLGLVVHDYASASHTTILRLRHGALEAQLAMGKRKMETDEDEEGPSERPPPDAPYGATLATLCGGRCMRLAMMLLGAEAVRQLEGGPALRGAALWSDVWVAGALEELLQALLAALNPRLPWRSPPGPLTATRLLLRLGLALVRQGRVTATAAAETARPEGGAAGAAGVAGSGDGSRADGAAAAAPQILALLGAQRWRFAQVALLQATEHASARFPLGKEPPGWAAAVTETWRLAGTLLQEEAVAAGVGAGAGAGAGAMAEAVQGAVGPEALERLVGSLTGLVCTMESSWDFGDAEKGLWVFPAEALPGVAAAAAGGALPLLEGLLRRTGRSPAGPEAALLSRVRSQGGSGDWWPAVPLLAYGPPLQAAALLATATKLLRVTPARCLLQYSGSTEAQGLAFVADVVGLLAFAPAPVNIGRTKNGDPARGPLRQLSLVLSPALPEWVRQLARLLREAAALEEGAWQRELRRGREERAAQPGRRARTVKAEAREVEDMLLLRLLRHMAFLVGLELPLPRGQDEALPGEDPAGPGPASAWQPRPPERAETAGAGCAAGVAPSAAATSSVLSRTEAVEVIGAALTLVPRLAPSHGGTWSFLSACVAVGDWCLALAASLPSDVRAAATAASGGGAGSSALAWRPEALRALAGALADVQEVEAAEVKAGEAKAAEAAGEEVGLAEALKALAVRVEGWGADGGKGEVGSEAAQDRASGVVGDKGFEFGWEGSLWGAVAGFALPSAEARRRLGLPACSNPACANLAGDSEAGLPLRLCGRCGRASYCCRECQTAHWQAGHRGACGGCGKEYGSKRAVSPDGNVPR
ncbi:hypothetical protein HYH03_019117 [Edaphochlamys debaryana]|uniref:phytol kinase n=1 Tax=Edaphochlamys debaryana TaxID=47281 RepID=A0A836BNP2_9CHLO|nr:hypothetical protein HYH03_019117 [Edaphochlamys debaryana]|eukprot:KAG2481929.1 hypothetical protein HYH03_019117 [Edaphochlamys debaryana]